MVILADSFWCIFRANLSRQVNR